MLNKVKELLFQFVQNIRFMSMSPDVLIKVAQLFQKIPKHVFPAKMK